MMETLLAWDHRVFFWINGWSGSAWDYVFAWPTFLTTPIIMFLSFLLMAVWGGKDLFRKMLYVGFAGGTGALWGAILKETIGRPRPFGYFYDRILSGDVSINTIYHTYTSNAMPSGHTMYTFAMIAALNFAYPKKLFYLYPIGLLISFSRVYVGAHFPSDIAAGALLGSLCGYLACVFLQRVFPRLTVRP